ncbi:MAG: hypothetical protein MJ086_01160 [Lachnospiraceae bacterium]|nr:hypothetical protein [Lachnospiraceae bacterium]
MKKKILIIVSAAAVCVIAFCILVLTGVIQFKSGNEELVKGKALCYVKYMDTYMLLDKNNVVTGSTTECPENLPEISGVSFDSIIVGKKFEPKDEAPYKYALKLVDCFKKNSLGVSEVYVADDMKATVYVAKVKILMGVDENTEEKINDLRDFYDDLIQLEGTLDMQELSKNNIGYSFRQNKK